MIGTHGLYREREEGRKGKGKGLYSQSVLTQQCFVDRKKAVISYLPPLFWLHALRVQHNHWEERRWQKGREQISTSIKQFQSSILLLQMLFVMFLLCRHLSFIILTHFGHITEGWGWWCCSECHCDDHMQRKNRRSWPKLDASRAHFKMWIVSFWFILDFVTSNETDAVIWAII